MNNDRWIYCFNSHQAKKSLSYRSVNILQFVMDSFIFKSTSASSPFSFPHFVSFLFSSSHLFSLLVLLSAPQLNQQWKQEADLCTHALAHPLSHTHHWSNRNTLFSITVPIFNDLMKIRVCVTQVTAVSNSLPC